MNQGSSSQTVAPAEANSVENRYVVEASQVHASTHLPSMSGPEVSSWNMHSSNTSETGSFPSSSYLQEQQTETSTAVQDGTNATSLANSSSFGMTNPQPNYIGYGSYSSSTDPYGYGSTGYPGYYNGYQQQPNHSYSQPVGVYQNTGAPYQPLSSFQNSGSYAGHASYSSTYYNPADYQTAGGYSSSSYTDQTATWNDGSYANYTTSQYPNYTADTSSAYSSSNAAATSFQYQQHYKQWTDYYNQTEVSCAPGTENLSVSRTSNQACQVPTVSSGYATSSIQAPQPYITPWRPEPSLSQTPPLQPVAAVSGAYDSYWKQGTQSFQNQHPNSIQPHFQNPMESKASYSVDNSQEQQKNTVTQFATVQNPTASLPSQNYQSPLQTVPSSDTRRLSKMQIQTNPRIASNLPLGLTKTEKDDSSNNAEAKPAYISVSLPKSSENVLSSDAADSVLKPGTFPPSLCGYVERALGRCKNDTQISASQAVLKEVITKASADGTLHTKNWDIEPLFPLPNAEMVGIDSQGSMSATLPRYKRSPTKRPKSRWEPLPEEKPIDQASSINNGTAKYGSWLHTNGKDNKPMSANYGGRINSFGHTRFNLVQQKSASKIVEKPMKRRRVADWGALDNDNGDASSDSDKEQSLTPYYSSAMALADSPEEQKRRESRSKRFEKAQGNRPEVSRFKPKSAGTGDLYTRRASVLVLSKDFNDGGSRAVEDIDWDALTVKGTCQEIEKRYLRLTSAPDPSTVRPEEVLEKALQMVQTSQKNYLYKCDQLKSIRQDLTVQRIRNQLTVKVYETHARLAIEVGDLPEYNQCQSQLKILYAEGIEGCHMEFSAYNLLCFILHSNNYRDLLSSMSRLSDDAKKDRAVQHALSVRAAVTSGNYVMFFKLYKTAPNLNTCLMDLYVEKMRYKAVNRMSRSYRPTIPVSYIAQLLGFSSSTGTPDEGTGEKESDGLEECMEWLKAHGACVIADNNGEMQLDAKASSSSLFMPDPEDAVSHGDANLAVNDFLTRTLSVC